MQKMYLSKALAAKFFDNPQNAMNARLHFFYVQKPYKLAWYSFMSKENHANAESFVWPIENYAVPGCTDTIESSPDMQILCRDIAKRIAAQPSNSLTMRLMATALAVKLGATELQPELDLLRLQNNAFSETTWKTNLVSPRELAKAYENGKQYELAVHTIEKYRLFEKIK